MSGWPYVLAGRLYAPTGRPGAVAGRRRARSILPRSYALAGRRLWLLKAPPQPGKEGRHLAVEAQVGVQSGQDAHASQPLQAALGTLLAQEGV